jgi:hypothetical protein
LPAGSIYVQAKTVPDPDYQLKPGEEPAPERTTHVYFTTDGSTTWIVGSESEEEALSRARALIDERAPTLVSKHFNFDAHREARVLGFLSPRGTLL